MDKSTEQLESKGKILPEIIYIQYESEFGREDLANLQHKLSEGNILLQQAKSGKNEYNDVPELVLVKRIEPPKTDSEQRTILKNHNESIVDISDSSQNYENEISTAVSSIKDVEDASVKFFPTTIMMELNEAENNPILMYACKNLNEEPINRYPCDHCDIILGCIFCLKSHYESVHLKLGVLQYQCTQIMNNINQADVCPKCRLICPDKTDMLEHRKVHFVTCNICEMSFDSPLYLSNHCKTHHDNFEVILTCDLCEETFRQLLQLSDHYQTTHLMNLCIVCLKRFSTKGDLELHHKGHKIVLTPEAPMPFACSKCDMAFNTISDLSKHLNVIHAKKRKTASGTELGTVGDNKAPVGASRQKIVKTKKV